MKKQTIVIHDVESGYWELNKLAYPLQHPYRPGLSSVILVPEKKMISGVESTEAVFLTAPKWYQYVWFGVKMLFNIGKRRAKTFVGEF